MVIGGNHLSNMSALFCYQAGMLRATAAHLPLARRRRDAEVSGFHAATPCIPSVATWAGSLVKLQDQKLDCIKVNRPRKRTWTFTAPFGVSLGNGVMLSGWLTCFGGLELA